MKTKLNLRKIVVAGLLAFGMATAVKASVVYDNSVNYLGTRYTRGWDVNGQSGTSTAEFGDEIYLSGLDRVLSGVSFEYYSIANAGSLTFRMYNNDGDATGSRGDDSRGPGSLLYSFTTAIEAGDAQNHLNLVSVTPSQTITLPDKLTWTVRFYGVESYDQVGLTLYSPVSVGSSYDDFWMQDEGWNWGTMRSPGGDPAMNFGITITAVPEASTMTMAALGGLALLALRAYRRN